MRYSERLSSLKLRISCFGLRKMQLLTLSPDYSNMSFLFRLQLSFWRRNECYIQFEHQEMRFRINVANYSQFNAKTMFTTVHKSVLQRNSVVTWLSFWPIGVWKCLSSIKMQAINYERRFTVLLFFIGYFVHCTIWVWFDFFFQAICFWFAKAKFTEKRNQQTWICIWTYLPVKNYYCRLSALQVVINSCFFFYCVSTPFFIDRTFTIESYQRSPDVYRWSSIVTFKAKYESKQWI